MDNTNTLAAGNILVVDDTPENLHVLSAMLKEKGHKVRPALNGEVALQAAEKSPPDLILLDIMMPGMDGYEVCRRLKANSRLHSVPVLFISALTETAEKVRAFACGGVDYVTKPFQLEEVQARVGTHLQLHRLQAALEDHNTRLRELVREQVQEISDSQMATIFALAKLAESRDDDTGRHLERVQAFCKMLAEDLLVKAGYRDTVDPVFVENILRASPLHDIGKVGIPDSILLKAGRLTQEEFAVMKKHTLIGVATLEAVQEQYPRNAFVSMGIEIARSHHEKWDGTGYPDGLAGNTIPVSARILALADVYDALRSPRCYKKAFSHEQSRDIILQGAGAQFDPAVAEVFRRREADFARVREDLHDS